VQELIEYARKNPGKTNFGSSGIGASTHLSGELFKSMAGVEITHVPYKGSGQVIQDLLGGNVQLAIDSLSVYIDGADEIDGHGFMVKGGGAALTREKIVAAMAQRFVCIADESKQVHTLGAFPLPVEVIPMAAASLVRRFADLGGQASLRMRDGQALVTDNGQHIVDVTGLKISDPLQFETDVNQWPGVVTVGVFAHQKAQVCLLGTASGVKTLTF
jgi:ribose 5-phosphate isomerase A